LKASAVCGALKWSGRVFHSLGSAEEKARSPMVQSVVLGTWRVVLVAERRVHEEIWGVRNSLRYWGACP